MRLLRGPLLFFLQSGLNDPIRIFVNAFHNEMPNVKHTKRVQLKLDLA